MPMFGLTDEVAGLIREYLASNADSADGDRKQQEFRDALAQFNGGKPAAAYAILDKNKHYLITPEDRKIKLALPLLKEFISKQG
jgi:hypothetical protein